MEFDFGKLVGDLGAAAKSMADNAGGAVSSAGGMAAKIAGDAANAATGAASKAADAAADAVDSAVNAASEVVDGAVKAVGQAASDFKEKREAEEAERSQRIAVAVEEGIRTALDAGAGEMLATLGDSPLKHSEDMWARVKDSFPIPVEQQVVWADAEFDLRPSGIVATDRGVYIKSDASAFQSPFANEEEKEQSALFFYCWDSFDPVFFTGDGEDNRALSVDPDHSGRFVEACRQLAGQQAENDALSLSGLEREDHLAVSSQKVAAAAAAAVKTSENAVFGEQKARCTGVDGKVYAAGHGEMVEDAHNMIDRLQGREVFWEGRSNKRNGADRIVDGAEIQTKYYRSAQGTLESAFGSSDGMYRYVSKKTGEPMMLEVPRDQYEQVLKRFRRKIEEGKVPGVSDPAEARKYVKRGRLSYRQAVNLTKPGTVESLAYDAAKGVVTCSSAFGITFVSTAFLAYRDTKDASKAVQAGVVAGAQVFGMAFLQHMVVSQLARTGLSHVLMTPSQYLVGKLGSQASATIVNGLRALSGKAAISGAAATSQLAKILRTNVVTTAATLAVCSIPQTYNLAAKKISSAQYVKNMAVLTGSMAAGAGGALAAGVAAAKVGTIVGTAAVPAVGTAVGAVGGFLGGAAGSMALNVVGNAIREDDAVIMGRYINAMVACLASEYLLSSDELDKVIDELDGLDFSALVESLISSSEQERVVRDALEPLFESVVARREPFDLPSDDEIVAALDEMMEEPGKTPCEERENRSQ